MTREEMINELLILSENVDSGDLFVEVSSSTNEALIMAIKSLKATGHLKDRPCSVCEFRKENGCCKWTCVFEKVLR